MNPSVENVESVRVKFFGDPVERQVNAQDLFAAFGLSSMIIRTTAAGHPAGQKQQVSLTFTGTATDNGTMGIVLQGALLDATVNEDVGIILGNTANEMADAAAAALEANADVIAAGYDITRVDNQVFVTVPEFAAEDSTLYLSMSPGTTGADEAEFTEIVTGALPATASAIGQDCRYGDESPYRWFKAESVTPSTVWFEVTPGVVENRDTSTSERLFIQDSIIQTELLS